MNTLNLSMVERKLKKIKRLGKELMTKRNVPNKTASSAKSVYNMVFSMVFGKTVVPLISRIIVLCRKTICSIEEAILTLRQTMRMGDPSLLVTLMHLAMPSD